jgi:uncharacterized protein (TIRG00374 family)
VVSAALVIAAFGFAIPHFASYPSVWASVDAMAWPQAVLIAVAAVGLALLASATAGLGLLIRSESFALGAGRALQRALTVTFRLIRRRVSFNIPGSLAGFRGRASTLIAVRGWRITAATLASNLTLWLVLLACLRGVGLSQSVVPWQTSLAAFASVRLLTVLPITPGGLGIAELGLIGIMAADDSPGASHWTLAQISAAVLLYRAVTYLLPIPMGVIAWLTWRHAPGFLNGQRTTAQPPSAAEPVAIGEAAELGSPAQVSAVAV